MRRSLTLALGSLLVCVAILAPPDLRAVAAESRTAPGMIQRFDLATFSLLSTLTADGSDDEFGAHVVDNLVATAPGAAGGGRIFALDRDGIESSSSATELLVDDTERCGESFADVGHPPGIPYAMVFGAPATPGAARGALPAAVTVNLGGTGRFTHEVRRVEGTPGSLFGWRLLEADNQSPAAPYQASYVVTAPLEGSGKKSRAGAVYKFDTLTGAQIWKFRGERADELAGYSLSKFDDVNGDGTVDVLVGAPGTLDGRTAGRVYVLSGASGAVLRRIAAPAGSLLFGYAVDGQSVFDGVLISAPATAQGKKDQAGAVYAYPKDLNGAPRTMRGRRRGQWFGISMAASFTHLFVGSFEEHRNAKKDRRGSVTVLLPEGRPVKTIRGKDAGAHFGRTLYTNVASGVLAVGVPGAPPLFVPE